MSFNQAKFGVALRDMHEQLGTKGTVEAVRDMLEKKEILPEQCSLREIYEAVGTSDFPVVTGEIISSTIISEFKDQDLVGDKLCNTVPSKLEVDKIAGFEAPEMPEAVEEGREYNDSSFSEKWVTSHNHKFGRLLTITEEAVYFDKTNEILNRAKGIGRKARIYKEMRVVQGVQDILRCYYPSGELADFYSATNGNLITSNPFGEAGLVAVLKATHGMKDENGDPIYISPRDAVCLVPVDLWVEANQMNDSEKVPEGVDNAKNVFKGAFTPLTSPYVSSASSSTWYYGNPKMSFVWTEVWPLEVFTQKPGSDDLFKKDLSARFKVRFFGNLAATSFQYFFKCTA